MKAVPRMKRRSRAVGAPSQPMPTALRALLGRVRAELNGTMRKDTVVNVTMGWPELQAIYELAQAGRRAREARDQLQETLRGAERTIDIVRANVADQDLLDDARVLRVLKDVERVFSGEETSAAAVTGTHRAVKQLLARARKKDRRTR